MKGLIFLLLFTAFISSCTNESPKKNEPNDINAEQRNVYLKKGGLVARETFKALASELRNAIEKDGLDKAISICNLHAIPITDSLSEAFDVSIKRTSLRIRNQNNRPTLEEKHMLKLYQRAAGAGEEMKPFLLVPNEQTVVFYSPIFMKALCLNCHGELGSTLSDETYKTITDLYPADKAIGYKLDEFRGMWSIRMDI